MRRRRAALALAAAALAALAAAASPPAASADEFDLGALAGIHLGRESAFRDIYGAALPLGLEARFIMRRIGLSIGGFTLGRTGTAVSPDGGAENYPVKIRMTSFPVTAFLRIPWGRARLDLGLGAVLTSFAETWTSGGFRTEDSALGFLIGANAEYDVGPRLALAGTVRVFSAPTGRDSILGNEIDLGGIQVLAGVTYRLWRKK